MSIIHPAVVLERPLGMRRLPTSELGRVAEEWNIPDGDRLYALPGYAACRALLHLHHQPHHSKHRAHASTATGEHTHSPSPTAKIASTSYPPAPPSSSPDSPLLQQQQSGNGSRVRHSISQHHTQVHQRNHSRSGSVPSMSFNHLTPTSHSMGARSLSENLPTRMLLKPRVIILVLFALLIALLTIHEDSREAAHSALKKVGVPLPDQLPEWELGLDSVKAGLNKWTGSIVGGGNSGDIDGLSGGDSWRATNDDEEALLNTEWEDIAEPASPNSGVGSGGFADPNEPEVNKMTYHPTNGYLLLPDPGKIKSEGKETERHPILELIENAEKKWDRLVKKQSKTLKEAALEYKKRYLRNPPKGFDKWFEYAQKNNIVLKDEYDQIFRDIQPFWAIEPHDLVHRSKVMTNDRAETFTLNIDPSLSGEHKITITGEEAKLKRATDLAALIERFSAELPGNVNITFTKHDQPACALGYQHKERLLELVAEGDYFTSSDFIRPENPELTNWANGCPANSPLYLSEVGELHESHPSHPSKLEVQRSFVYDHARSMDICQHPENMHLHGFTSALGTNLANLVPLFTFAKTNLHSDILATPLEQYSDYYIGYDPVWDEKLNNKLLWRGSTTGAEFMKGVDWKLSQRARLHFMSHEKEGTKNVLWADKKESKMKVDDFQVKDLNQLYMDVAFSGTPVQCDEETCKVMEKIIDFAPTMGLDESYQYKYLMDVDGNGWSGRFHRLMSTKSVVLKSTIFPEWYTERIMPWVHYVPIKVDYSDLYDVMTFFVGTPDGKGSHDEIAAKIAAQGKEWARLHWRKEDMASYMYRLVLEWIRLLHRVDDVEWDYIVD